MNARLKSTSLAVIFAAFLFAACGEQKNGFKSTNAEATDGDDTTTGKTTKKTSKTNGTANATEGDDGDGKTTGGDADGDGSDDSTDVDNAAAGLAFFEKSVAPVFQAKCVSCHADPRQPADIRGPLSIYSYNAMRAKLLVGPSSKDNDLINKVMNKIGHDGADRCGGSYEASPCKEIVNWRTVEKGEDGDVVNGGIAGRVFEVTSLGKIIGWAYNPDKLDEQLNVVFYVDGPSGTGTKVGPTVANRSGADNNTPGDHAFLFDVPTTLRDKKKHTLHAYVVIDGKETQVGTQPYEFTAYAPSDEGRAFYNANVANAVSGCGSCHALSYEQHFYALVSPAPSQGGTATNNVLINKAGARNGTAHGGGNRCGGGNPCTVFEQWWDKEFGTP